jgi:hypothetical protein
MYSLALIIFVVSEKKANSIGIVWIIGKKNYN